MLKSQDDLDYILELHIDCLVKLGSSLFIQRKTDEALSVSAQAISLADILAEKTFHDVAREERLAMCYQSYGNALLDLGKRSESRKYFRKAIEARSRIDASQLPGVTRRLAGTLINEGRAFWGDHDWSRAEDDFRQASQCYFRARRILEPRDSSDVLLAQLYVNWTGLMLGLDRFDEVFEKADEGLKRIEQLLRAEPDEGVLRETCLQLHGNKAYALAKGKHRESAESWARVLELSPQPIPDAHRAQLAIELLLQSDQLSSALLRQAQLVKGTKGITGRDRYNLACLYAR